MPSEFGDAPDDEHRALGAVLEQHYKLIDDAIGRAIAALGPDDVMLVVSGFGMEPMGLWKRLVERVIGDPDLNGTHDAAPDGFVMAYGAPVARGRLPTRASVVDVTPRFCISWAFRSVVTWTGTPARISFSAPSPTNGRSRSFRRTIDEL